MECKICKRIFYERKTLLNLFKKEEGIICPNCYKKYPIELSYESFPLENYNCLVVSIFKYNYKINYDYFIKKYQKIYERLDNMNSSELLFFDFIDITNQLSYLNEIANLMENNIIILTFNFRK